MNIEGLLRDPSDEPFSDAITVALWDAASIKDQPLAETRPKADGRFAWSIDLPLKRLSPLARVAVRLGEHALPATHRALVDELQHLQKLLIVDIQRPPRDLVEPHLTIDSWSELSERAPELLARIHACPNGALRYSVQPLRLLADLGIELAPAVQKQIQSTHPHLVNVTEQAYRAACRHTGAGPKLALTQLFREI